MAILLKKDITDNLARNNPMQDLHEENLYDFMTVVEEVDHFCYAANRAKRDRPFTLLEVEIQGSITRYLIAVKYMRRHGRLKFNNMAAMDGLFEMVFDAYEYKNDMHEFSYYVGLRFCRKLKNMLLDLNMKEFNRSLKDFYHYGLTDKICCALYRSRLCRT